MAVHFQGNELYSVGAGESDTNKQKNETIHKPFYRGTGGGAIVNALSERWMEKNQGRVCFSA